MYWREGQPWRLKALDSEKVPRTLSTKHSDLKNDGLIEERDGGFWLTDSGRELLGARSSGPRNNLSACMRYIGKLIGACATVMHSGVMASEPSSYFQVIR